MRNETPSKKTRGKSGRPAHLLLGETGERKALEYLKTHYGYRIVALNYLIPLGRSLSGRKTTGEIDAIAYDGDILVFIEVKTRSTVNIASPERAVGLRKQRQIARAARRYRQMMNVSHEPYRYDVVSIIKTDNGYRIELIKGYFNDSVFKKARWYREEF